jgi:fructokinase
MTEKSLIHVFGEVLFDHFPDGSRVLGGAPFNVAWHLQAFGQKPRFVSRVGEDPPGHEIVALMSAWGMRRDGLQSDSEHPTGSVRVLIEDGEPHYDIVADSAYDFISAAELGGQDTEGILYHGSLAARNPVARAALQTVKLRHKGKIFVDVNLRPPWWRTETLLPMLNDADWVKLNETELVELCPGHATLEDAIQEFCKKFGMDTLVVTRGAEGAFAYDRRQHGVAVKPAENLVVVDTVGAGDAFAAVLLLGLSQEWPLQTTLNRAQEFAGAIVGRRGATVADTDFYRRFHAQWDLHSP